MQTKRGPGRGVGVILFLAVGALAGAAEVTISYQARDLGRLESVVRSSETRSIDLQTRLAATQEALATEREDRANDVARLEGTLAQAAQAHEAFRKAVEAAGADQVAVDKRQDRFMISVAENSRQETQYALERDYDLLYWMMRQSSEQAGLNEAAVVRSAQAIYSLSRQLERGAR